MWTLGAAPASSHGLAPSTGLLGNLAGGFPGRLPASRTPPRASPTSTAALQATVVSPVFAFVGTSSSSPSRTKLHRMLGPGRQSAPSSSSAGRPQTPTQQSTPTAYVQASERGDISTPPATPLGLGSLQSPARGRPSPPAPIWTALREAACANNDGKVPLSQASSFHAEPDEIALRSTASPALRSTASFSGDVTLEMPLVHDGEELLEATASPTDVSSLERVDVSNLERTVQRLEEELAEMTAREAAQQRRLSLKLKEAQRLLTEEQQARSANEHHAAPIARGAGRGTSHQDLSPAGKSLLKPQPLESRVLVELAPLGTPPCFSPKGCWLPVTAVQGLPSPGKRSVSSAALANGQLGTAAIPVPSSTKGAGVFGAVSVGVQRTSSMTILKRSSGSPCSSPERLQANSSGARMPRRSDHSLSPGRATPSLLAGSGSPRANSGVVASIVLHQPRAVLRSRSPTPPALLTVTTPVSRRSRSPPSRGASLPRPTEAAAALPQHRRAHAATPRSCTPPRGASPGRLRPTLPPPLWAVPIVVTPNSATRSAAKNPGMLLGLPGPQRRVDKREPTPPPSAVESAAASAERRYLNAKPVDARGAASPVLAPPSAARKRKSVVKKGPSALLKGLRSGEVGRLIDNLEAKSQAADQRPDIVWEANGQANGQAHGQMSGAEQDGERKKKPLAKGAKGALTRALKSGEVARIVDKMEADNVLQDSKKEALAVCKNAYQLAASEPTLAREASALCKNEYRFAGTASLGAVEKDAAATLDVLNMQDPNGSCKRKHAALVTAPSHESPTVAQLPAIGLSHSPSECPSPPTAPLGQVLTAATATAIARAQSACEDLPEKFFQPVAETVERLKQHFEARRHEARSRAQLVSDEAASWPPPVPVQVEATQRNMELQSSNLATTIPQNFYLSPVALPYSTVAEHHPFVGADVGREGDVASSEGEADLAEGDVDAELRLSKAMSRLGRQLDVLEQILTLADRSESCEKHTQDAKFVRDANGQVSAQANGQTPGVERYGNRKHKKPLMKGAKGALTRALKSGEVARIVDKMEADNALQDSKQEGRDMCKSDKSWLNHVGDHF